ncbi:MAG: arginine deiminase family protein [Acidobacteriota bacterium]|nr:arginine deiminase family protein [Acidobacteriota bacterium]
MIAVTRDVSPSIAHAELTHLPRVPIDYERAREQHEEYRALLSSLGCTVISLPGDAAYPDCVFIEDTAVVFDEMAVITRPGAPSRRGEVDVVAEALAPLRKLVRIEAPATIDGGDVLVLDERIYVGRSERSNEEALAQLRRLTGREVIGVDLHGALHLKTAITRVSHDTLLVNREWVDVTPFAGWTLLDVDPAEPFGANAVLLDDVIVYPVSFSRTRAKLESRGFHVRIVHADELAKAEGGVTCCSLLMR